MVLAAAWAEAIGRQRGHWFLWVPVCLGMGVGAYFALPSEPSATGWAALSACFAAAAGAALARGGRMPGLVGICLVLAGVLLAGARTHGVAAPVLDFRYYGPIEGRIVAFDRSISDKPRLTLDQVVLARMDPNDIPGRIRVTLHGSQGFLDPEIGMTVIVTAHLSPPSGPVEPGGFDFQRQARFKGLGAVGYSRTPALVLEPPASGGISLTNARVRKAVSDAVRSHMPEREGAFAAAITSGDRSAIDRQTLDDLRASNLAHLLAISGLHMGLLTGFVFAALRYGLLLLPAVGPGLPSKKIGAMGALIAGAGYLALSGGNVATERAYIMAAVVLGAVLLDRRALTLRAVAVAATIVPVLRPEALVQPGFQMSFAATTALVAIFGALRNVMPKGRGSLAAWAASLVVSSAVAGAATAPYAAAHFNILSHYGLVANLLSVPLMGAVIVPSAVLAAVLWPFGLGWLGLALMAPGIGWILGVAETVSGWPGAVRHVPVPPGGVIAILSLGALVVILWQGRLRWLGLAPVALAVILWTGAERPPLLVAASGGLIGMMSEDGRILSKPRGEGFTALSWLENDGDPAIQADASARRFEDDRAGRLANRAVVHVTGRSAAERAAEACQRGALVITPAAMPARNGRDCTLIDKTYLRRSGALAISVRDGKLDIRTARSAAGQRPWNTPAN